ncbi:trimethylamine methyltransferase family protein [Desulfococcaceae bacterium HSG9]|nr:trimethylamine methyltransferase family protein [Desulfococcaceae bacterium HSG9]
MKTHLQVLSQNEKDQVHERSLGILSRTGVRVDTAKGRRILKEAGAQVDENTRIVRFPNHLVEDALRLATKSFSLGARRPGWDLQMNQGDCTLLLSGEGTRTLDLKTGVHRDSTFNDWLKATRLADALDDISIYWRIVQATDRDNNIPHYIEYITNLFRNFSKHVQDPIYSKEEAPWFLEVLQTVFGSKENIREKHPVSFVLCPQSPLTIDEHYTDAYLELLGWDIPVAVMPMPLMGATAPATQIATVVLANCEVLATLCLVQAAEPGAPFIYAPVPALMDPRSGMLKSGAIERAAMSAAATEMARYYGFPAETSGFSTGQFTPNMQAASESALNTLPAMLSWPDILVGVGLLGSSMILCLEQMLIDTEVFRMCKQAHRGIVTGKDKWLDDVIDRVGPGGHFLDLASTARAVRGDEWYIGQLGRNTSFEEWEAAGKPGLLEEAREKVEQILSSHRPLPLDEEIERELNRILKKAQDGVLK